MKRAFWRSPPRPGVTCPSSAIGMVRVGAYVSVAFVQAVTHKTPFVRTCQDIGSVLHYFSIYRSELLDLVLFCGCRHESPFRLATLLLATLGFIVLLLERLPDVLPISPHRLHYCRRSIWTHFVFDDLLAIVAQSWLVTGLSADSQVCTECLTAYADAVLPRFFLFFLFCDRKYSAAAFKVSTYILRAIDAVLSRVSYFI